MLEVGGVDYRVLPTVPGKATAAEGRVRQFAITRPGPWETPGPYRNVPHSHQTLNFEQKKAHLANEFLAQRCSTRLTRWSL